MISRGGGGGENGLSLDSPVPGLTSENKGGGHAHEPEERGARGAVLSRGEEERHL